MIRENNRESFLIISNISKRANIQQLLTVASAYDFTAILVGMTRILSEIDTSKHKCLMMDELNHVKLYCQSLGVVIIGLEIGDESVSLTSYTFPQSVAIMPGNEGTGLNARQREIVDEFVYIPQYGNGIESLNVTVATTIMIYSYSSRRETRDNLMSA